jgi:hypothetical protein
LAPFRDSEVRHAVAAAAAADTGVGIGAQRRYPVKIEASTWAKGDSTSPRTGVFSGHGCA